MTLKLFLFKSSPGGRWWWPELFSLQRSSTSTYHSKAERK